MNAVAKRDAPPADFWQGRSVLITGCNGFLGTRMTQLLVERGAEVVGLVRDQVPWSPLHREGIDTRMVTVRGEVQDQALIERVLNEYEVTCVFHLAAQAIVGVANRNPVATFESNIQGTWCVLEACRRSRLIERVVVASRRASSSSSGAAASVSLCSASLTKARNCAQTVSVAEKMSRSSDAANLRAPPAEPSGLESVKLASQRSIVSGQSSNSVRAAGDGEHPLVKT